MKTLFSLEQRTDGRQVFPSPADGATVYETPPCLVWILPEPRETVRVSLMQGGREIWSGETDRNYIIPSRILEPGEYEWDVFTASGHRGIRRFRIAEDAAPFLPPTAEEILTSIPEGHPRHLFSESDIPTILENHAREIETLKRNVALAMQNRELRAPMFHLDSDALPYREYFGYFRDLCDRDLVALALGYALLGDEAAGAEARRRLLWICNLSPSGAASVHGAWGDEVGLSLARCLPSLYDLVYPLLSDKERAFVAETVALYAEQCERRLSRLDYCANPGDSHAGRLPAYLGEAALVLGDSGVRKPEVLASWLSYAVEIYGGIFPFYGGSDGAWGGGTFYATSYTRWYLPFFSAVERYTGKSFLSRPFYRNLTQFFLHFANPDYENHPFGDGYWCTSEDEEWPGFFAQSPCRYYAERFGPALARRRAEEAVPELFRLHLLDVFLANREDAYPAPEARNLQAFEESGYVSMHTCLSDTSRDTACLIRASRYGSTSHSHPDQGGFALFHRGVALVSPSGYFGRRYGTLHHKLWLNTSRAHNVLLFDGTGQLEWSHLAVGKVLSAEERDGVMTAAVSAGEAYGLPLTWIRRFVLDGMRLTVTDTVKSEHPVSITYPLHFLSAPTAEGNVISLSRRGVFLSVTPLSGISSPPRISDAYDVDLNEGEPPEFHVTMPPQYHAYYEIPAATEHEISVQYLITDSQV